MHPNRTLLFILAIVIIAVTWLIVFLTNAADVDILATPIDNTISKNLAPHSAKSIYRWTDAQGITQYGDEKPKDSAIVIEGQSEEFAFHQPYSVSVTPISFDLSRGTKAKLEIAILKIFEIHRDALNLRLEDGAHISVQIVRNFDVFERYQKQFTSSPDVSTGFYLNARKDIVVWKNKNNQALLSAIAHASSHAIFRYQTGLSLLSTTPMWITEGLAEYFKTIEVFNAAVTIPTNISWETIVQQYSDLGQLMPLKDYLSLSNSEWIDYNRRDDLATSMSWALIYFLMGSREGRQLLQSIIEHSDSTAIRNTAKQAKNKPKEEPIRLPEVSVNSGLEQVDLYYYGGIQRLEESWHQWIKRNKTAHRY